MLLGSQHLDVRHHDVVVHPNGRSEPPGPGPMHLFDQDHRVKKIRPDSPVLLVQPVADEPLLSHLAPDVSRDLAIFPPFIEVGLDLLIQKAT